MKKGELREIIARVLEIKPEDLLGDTRFADIQTYDSVNVLTLMIELEEKAGVQMSHTDVEEMKTYGDLETIVVRKGIPLEA